MKGTWAGCGFLQSRVPIFGICWYKGEIKDHVDICAPDFDLL